MNIKAPIKKFFTIIIWCLLGASGLAILIAAINSKNSSLCQGLELEINGGDKAYFLNKKDLIVLLENEGLKDLRNKKITSIDLLRMEGLLRKNSWIKDAQLYFDNNQILKIRIRERQPFARIFTLSGNSFMIDSGGIQMAVPERTVFSLPVFTGYPEEKFGMRRDSTMDQQIRNLALFLGKDPFWSNQIEEVNISSGKTFTMTPLIGNQAIIFGDGNDFENKFHRLFVFYKQVLSQTGFDKYTGFNLTYSDQVIAIRKQGMISKADSIQAKKNVMEMIRMAEKMETDTTSVREIKPLEKNTLTEQNLRSYDLPEENDIKTEKENKLQKQQ
jgi:cell division protein FtsQ